MTDEKLDDLLDQMAALDRILLRVSPTNKSEERNLELAVQRSERLAAALRPLRDLLTTLEVM